MRPAGSVDAYGKSAPRAPRGEEAQARGHLMGTVTDDGSPNGPTVFHPLTAMGALLDAYLETGFDENLMSVSGARVRAIEQCLRNCAMKNNSVYHKPPAGHMTAR